MSKSISASFAQLYPLICDAIQRGDSFTFTAFGNSMKPYIKNGKDRVTLSPLTSDPTPGDVIFYRRENGSFVLHRIISLKDDTLLLCGDNQFSSEPISPRQVIAVLSSIERNGKVSTPNDPSHRLYLFFLPVRRFSLHFIYQVKVVIKKFLNHVTKA